MDGLVSYRQRLSCDTKFLQFSIIVLATSVLVLNQVPSVLSEEEVAPHNSTKYFDLWTRFDKGFDSINVPLGQTLPIRCRVSLNNTELHDEDDLSGVTMVFFKDNVILPDYWNNKTEAELAQVTAHSKFAFDFVEAQDSHRGLYKCVASFGGKTEELKFLVRVKTDRSELPAIIIGIEVVVLCFIYFIFDKRQKRMEAELLGEDSDNEGEKNHRN